MSRPQVSLTASSWQITAGHAITFTGFYTDPGVLDTHTGIWDFGDGIPLAGLPFQMHVELHDGLITVNLSPDETEPQAVASQPITFTAVMTDPGVLDTYTAVWDFGDGTIQASDWLVTTHTYNSNGQFTVTIAITDDDGGSGQDSQSIQVTSSPALPQLLYLPLVMNDACFQSSHTSDIILALDRSDSMNAPIDVGGVSKFAAAQAAAIEFLHLLQFPGDQAGIVSFANTALLEHPLSTDLNSLIQALDVSTEYSTRLDLALSQSRIELIGPHHISGNEQVIILLTDGQPVGVDIATVLTEANFAKSLGITIYAIGLGADVNASLLQAIATTPQHYFPAPSTDDLNTIYTEIAHIVNCASNR